MSIFNRWIKRNICWMGSTWNCLNESISGRDGITTHLYACFKQVYNLSWPHSPRLLIIVKSAQLNTLILQTAFEIGQCAEDQLLALHILRVHFGARNHIFCHVWTGCATHLWWICVAIRQIVHWLKSDRFGLRLGCESFSLASKLWNFLEQCLLWYFCGRRELLIVIWDFKHTVSKMIIQTISQNT